MIEEEVTIKNRPSPGLTRWVGAGTGKVSALCIHVGQLEAVIHSQQRGGKEGFGGKGRGGDRGNPFSKPNFFGSGENP